MRKSVILCCLIIFLAGCAAQAPYLRLDSSLQKDIRTFDGIQYVPLIRLCERYDLDWKWDSFVKTAVIEKKGRGITLRAGSKTILVNGSEKKLEAPVLVSGGAVFVPASFVRNNLGSIAERFPPEMAPEAVAPKTVTIRTVVIDAGHGGKDVGAMGRSIRLKEKNLTLAASKRLKKILEDNGIKVIMTRDDDKFISLPRRVEIANRSGSDLFVSVHANASRSRSLRGFECYYLSDATDDNARAIEALENASLKVDKGDILEHSKSLDATLWDMALTENRRESAELADHICDAVEDSSSVKNRGVRSARFYVLKWTRMPSVLVEMGYISNKYEEKKFKDTDFMNRIIDAVARGILAYKDRYERTGGFTNL